MLLGGFKHVYPQVNLLISLIVLNLIHGDYPHRILNLKVMTVFLVLNSK